MISECVNQKWTVTYLMRPSVGGNFTKSMNPGKVIMFLEMT